MNIAVLPRFTQGTFEGIWTGNRYTSPGNLTEICREFGVGLTLVLTPYDFEKVLSLCDGLFVPGSPMNIDPTYYGGEPFDPPNVFDEYAFDRLVIDSFVKADKPIFGICGGHQALNVFFGGSLKKVKELRGEREEPHASSEERLDRFGNTVTYKTHPITVEKDSFVYDVFGTTETVVNTYHGWALDRVAPDFRVVAKSADGIVEAMEHKEKKIFSTQWHPELANRMGDPVEMRFFENFFRCCQKASEAK